jgi:hypothetical protein
VENTTRRKNMKKIMALLLMVSVVAGMTLPAMATDGTSAGSSSNGGANTLNMDNSNTASNYAAHSVSVTLVAAPQTNNIGKNIAASGDNTNGAVATLAAAAKAEDAASGSGASGSSGSGAATSGDASAGVDKVKANDDSSASADPEAETGSAKSISKTGEVDTGDATNVAKVEDNRNSADANGYLLLSGSVDNYITQINVQKQITPVYISNDQEVKQSIKVEDVSQDANSEPVTIAKSKEKKTDIHPTDIDTTTIDTDVHFDDSPIEVEL